MVKNLPGHTGDKGSIPGQGTKIPKLHGAAKKKKNLPGPRDENKTPPPKHGNM